LPLLSKLDKRSSLLFDTVRNLVTFGLFQL
jgi:hypothetical protein